MKKLKAYRKWLKGKAGIGWYTGTEEGWRAALEEVFGWLDYSTEHEKIKDKIQEELE
ncbi:hypothetical protein LCGC14_0423130 [marine sediment metagenome]|uniref:Uncharacterized protein n=1 Tax=marine sediment metagenome TaxID=412755 RepID=A0A0F9SQJ0_9ZZZZ